MKNVKKIIWIIITLVVAFVYAHVDKNYYIYDRYQDSSEYIATGILKEGEKIRQEFVSQAEYIDGMNLKMSAYGDVSNVTVNYKLIDAESKKILIEGNLKAEDIENNKFSHVKFEHRIEKTKNKLYLLELKEEGSDDTNGVGFNVGGYRKTASETSLEIKGNDTEGSLVFRIFKHGFDIETFVMFLAFVLYIVVFMKALYKLFK